jgi:hypothetical protein
VKVLSIDERMVAIEIDGADRWQAASAALAERHEEFELLRFDYARHEEWCSLLAIRTGMQFQCDPTKQRGIFTVKPAKR